MIIQPARFGVPAPPLVYHNQYRLDISTNNGDALVGIGALYLYETAGGPDVASKLANSVGTATASSMFDSTQVPQSAFQGYITSASQPGWISASGTGVGWLQWQDNSPIDVVGFAIHASGVGDTAAPQNFGMQYSDDGVTWLTAFTTTGQTNWTVDYRVYTFASVGAHAYWRLNITANNGSPYILVQSLALSCANGEVIISSRQNVSIIASTRYDYTTDSENYMVNRQTTSTGWLSGAAVPQSIEFTAGRPLSLNSFALSCHSAARMPQNFTISGSSDNGVTWTVLNSYAGQTGWTVGETRTYTI